MFPYSASRPGRGIDIASLSREAVLPIEKVYTVEKKYKICFIVFTAKGIFRGFCSYTTTMLYYFHNMCD